MLQKKNDSIGRPLTLEEIRMRYDHNFVAGVIGYCGIVQDFRAYSCLYCGLCDYLEGKLIVAWNGDGDHNYLEENYGTDWVLWDHIPTEEERKAADAGKCMG